MMLYCFKSQPCNPALVLPGENAAQGGRAPFPPTNGEQEASQLPQSPGQVSPNVA